MATVIPSNRLNWQSTPEHSHTLHLDRRTAALITVVPDQTYPGMWRICFPDGSLSDLGNISRIKDAALHHALMVLNRKTETKESCAGAFQSDLKPPEGTRYRTPPAGLTQASSAAL